MTWITLTVVLGIAFWGGIIWWAATRNDPVAAPISRHLPESPKWAPLAVSGAAALLWLVASAALSLHTVGERQVAIVYNFSGTIAGKKDPGVVTTAPWQHVKKENVGILHDEWVFDSNAAAVSIDQQKITALLSVNYQIDPAQVVDLYRRVGAAWKSIIIDARVPQVFKEVTATYTTPELTAKREQLRIDTKRRLTDELRPYDIRVVDVFVRNIGFSQSYADAIEAKQKQVQDALTAQAKVAEKQAVARQLVAEAEGEAKANIARARGEATANRLRQLSLTPLLIQQQAIEKINPNVQVIICPPASVCIPNSGIVPQPQATP
ncbi:MAG: prohibitin family protein [Thermoleophilia bacterium]|nr:prohibitin family protein [Thermoleophilia bacterium]